MTDLRLISFVLALIHAPMVCRAEDRTSVDQLGQADSDATTVGQASGRSRELGGQQVSGREPPSHPTVQIGPRERGQAPAQIAEPARSARSSPQLNGGARSAEAPPPLSVPSDGRTGAVKAIGGADRCDAARIARLQGAEAAACRNIIERRAGEFERPKTPEPSPEERLLSFQAQTGSGSDARLAIGHLAAGQVTDAIAVQALSGANQADETPAKTGRSGMADLDPETQAIVQAIAQGLGVPGAR